MQKKKKTKSGVERATEWDLAEIKTMPSEGEWLSNQQQGKVVVLTAPIRRLCPRPLPPPPVCGVCIPHTRTQSRWGEIHIAGGKE